VFAETWAGPIGWVILAHFPRMESTGFLGCAAAVHTYGSSLPRARSETPASIAVTAKMVKGSKSADSEIHKLDLLYDQPNLPEGGDDAYILAEIIDAARGKPFTKEDREAQRRSFAYGNTHIENPHITRKTVDEQAELLTMAPKLAG
jgi:hypothetical protein